MRDVIERSVEMTQKSESDIYFDLANPKRLLALSKTV